MSHYVQLPSDDVESDHDNLPPKDNNERVVDIDDINMIEEDEIEISDPWVEKFALKQSKRLKKKFEEN